MVSEKSVEIDASSQVIWSYLSDVANWRQLTRHKTFLSLTFSDFRFLLPEGVSPAKGHILTETSDEGEVQPWWVEEWAAPSHIKLVASDKSTGPSDPACRCELELKIIPKTSLTTQVVLRSIFEIDGGFANWLVRLFTLGRTQTLFDRDTQSFLERLKGGVAAGART